MVEPRTGSALICTMANKKQLLMMDPHMAYTKVDVQWDKMVMVTGRTKTPKSRRCSCPDLAVL